MLSRIGCSAIAICELRQTVDRGRVTVPSGPDPPVRFSSTNVVRSRQLAAGPIRLELFRLKCNLIVAIWRARLGLEKPRDHIRQAGWCPRLALPDYEHTPALFLKPRTCNKVALDIASELGKPIVRIGGRLFAPKWAIVLVPEATVHKYHAAQPCEDKVGRSRQVAAMKSISIPEAVHEATDDHLGFGVGLSDASHTST